MPGTGWGNKTPLLPSREQFTLSGGIATSGCQLQSRVSVENARKTVSHLTQPTVGWQRVQGRVSTVTGSQSEAKRRNRN